MDPRDFSMAVLSIFLSTSSSTLRRTFSIHKRTKLLLHSTGMGNYKLREKIKSKTFICFREKYFSKKEISTNWVHFAELTEMLLFRFLMNLLDKKALAVFERVQVYPRTMEQFRHTLSIGSIKWVPMGFQICEISANLATTQFVFHSFIKPVSYTSSQISLLARPNHNVHTHNTPDSRNGSHCQLVN